MDVAKLQDFLIKKGIFLRPSADGKNLICICPLCGDHPDDKKKGHLYVATDKNTCHCFFCNKGFTISNFLTKFSDSKTIVSEILTKEEIEASRLRKGGIKKSVVRSCRTLTLPDLDYDSFKVKRSYLKTRVNFLQEPAEIPNVIFNMIDFFNTNKIPFSDPGEPDFLQNKYLGFLTKKHTYLICRSIGDTNIPYYKRKIQDDPLELLDYYVLPGGNPKSNLIVLSEGIFDLLGEYYTDSLHLKDKATIYASGQGFNYSALLKSICFDYHIFQADIIIISDRDKSLFHYKKFVRENEHVLRSLNIYYNKGKKDFGTFPIEPIKGGNIRDVQTSGKN